jgi:hypothetical protein
MLAWIKVCTAFCLRLLALVQEKKNEACGVADCTACTFSVHFSKHKASQIPSSHTPTQKGACMHTHAHTCTLMHPRTCTHKHTQTHPRARAHTHAHAHTRTQADCLHSWNIHMHTHTHTLLRLHFPSPCKTLHTYITGHQAIQLGKEVLKQACDFFNARASLRCGCGEVPSSFQFTPLG